ncbi:cupin domain-containing protein [Spongiimicrobium sp. 3-5]|uniref:cupin domain-containing protein n=1 Tax=Spongiimicrobium sp. 3-5 TaxID=3332596 RepID=UPI00397FB18F
MNIDLSNIPAREIMPGYFGKFFHTQHMTLAYWDVKEGSVVPEHSHMNEQVMQVLEGSFEFTVDGITNTYEAGDIAVIPANVPHGGKALTACRLMDVFSPAREDYM